MSAGSGCARPPPSLTARPHRRPAPPARSYECLAGNNVAQRAVTLNISRTSIVRSALPAVNMTIGGGIYLAPAEDA